MPAAPERAGAGGRALVYRGPATLPGCPEAVAAVLRASPLDLDVRFVGPAEDLPLTAEVLAGARVYAQSGGDELAPAWRRLRRSRRAVRRFVRQGGAYLGFCLGGYLAGETPGFGLLPGDADRWIDTAGARPDHDGDAVVEVTWDGRRRPVFFQDGPWFDLEAGRGPAEVLATYANGLPAAVVAPFGRGAVGVVGPHPEAGADWYTDSGLPLPADLPTDLARDLVERTVGSAGR